jgi:NTP pyrophosphatase (non-canonical NTP hydrolase)
MSDTPFEALRARVDQFAQDRDWRQFHSPKNLATCLSVEASELLELFMWTRDAPPFPPGTSAPDPQAVKDEVADVLICLLNFCIVSGIDPIAAAESKLTRLARKYPVATARGSAIKGQME